MTAARDTTGPALVLVAHGSRAPHGDRAAIALADAVAERDAARCVRLAYLSHGSPLLAEALGGLGDDGVRVAVVVPLLLSPGVHATADIERAMSEARAAHPDLSVVAAAPLGPDRLLVAAARERLGEASVIAQPGVVVVLAAAGSTDTDARTSVARTAEMLQQAAAYDAVLVADVAGPHPDLAATIARAHADGATTVAVVPYLLGDGHFADLVRSVRDDGVVVTAPIGAHDGVVDLVLVRYDEQLAKAGA